MTLTSILPTLRDSIPTPFDRDAWPVHTAPTTKDVVVAGISLLRYVELCGTPCVYTGPAVIPQSGGVPSPTESTTVVLTRVTAVEPPADGGPRIQVDAALCSHSPVWREIRLVERISHAPELLVRIVDCCGDVAEGARPLPADVRVGDLIAVPCVGCLCLGDVRPEDVAR